MASRKLRLPRVSVNGIISYYFIRLIKNENYEYLDNTIQMMSYFTYYSEGTVLTRRRDERKIKRKKNKEKEKKKKK